MGPLDMRGLLGAATVIGCLKYGAGVCGFDTEHRTVEMHLREASIDAGPDDGSFLASLRRSLANARGVYPPVAFAEVYCEDSRSLTKVRRLHLIMIDLDRSRNIGKQVYWQFQRAHLSARYEECFNTLPVPTYDPDCPHRCRYVYGYGIDGSDRPSYLLWPRRGSDGHFWLVDPMSGSYFDPSSCQGLIDYIAPIGLEHFFDAFALVHKRGIREAAAEALEIQLDVRPSWWSNKPVLGDSSLPPCVCLMTLLPREPKGQRNQSPLHMMLRWPLEMPKLSRKALLSPTATVLIPIQTSAVRMAPQTSLILTISKRHIMNLGG